MKRRSGLKCWEDSPNRELDSKANSVFSIKDIQSINQTKSVNDTRAIVVAKGYSRMENVSNQIQAYASSHSSRLLKHLNEHQEGT